MIARPIGLSDDTRSALGGRSLPPSLAVERRPALKMTIALLSFLQPGPDPVVLPFPDQPDDRCDLDRYPGASTFGGDLAFEPVGQPVRHRRMDVSRFGAAPLIT